MLGRLISGLYICYTQADVGNLRHACLPQLARQAIFSGTQNLYVLHINFVMFHK